MGNTEKHIIYTISRLRTWSTTPFSSFTWGYEGQRNGKFSQNGKLSHSCVRVTKGRLYESRITDHVIVHLGLNVSSSTYNCRGVVDGGNTIAAI